MEAATSRHEYHLPRAARLPTVILGTAKITRERNEPRARDCRPNRALRGIECAWSSSRCGCRIPTWRVLSCGDVSCQRAGSIGDFHVEVGKALHSVPKVYIGQYLDVRTDSSLVKLFHRGHLVKV